MLVQDLLLQDSSFSTQHCVRHRLVVPVWLGYQSAVKWVGLTAALSQTAPALPLIEFCYQAQDTELRHILELRWTFFPSFPCGSEAETPDLDEAQSKLEWIKKLSSISNMQRHLHQKVGQTISEFPYIECLLSPDPIGDIEAGPSRAR